MAMHLSLGLVDMGVLEAGTSRYMGSAVIMKCGVRIVKCAFMLTVTNYITTHRPVD